MFLQSYSTPVYALVRNLSAKSINQFGRKMEESLISQEERLDKPAKDGRIYFSMLERVGTIGRYQYLLTFFIFIVGMQASACFLVNPYLFYEQDFQCPEDVSNCREYVCGLAPQDRLPFTPTPDGRLSLANQYGDFRCEGSDYVTLLNGSIILGSVIGIFSAIFFTEWIGRKSTMIFSLFLGIIGLLSIYFWDKDVAVVGVFLYGAGLDIAYSCVFTFVTEFFSEQDRGKYYNIISMSFAAGIFLNPIAFYLISDWKWVVLVVFILPIIGAMLGFIYIVEDTPIELIAYETAEGIHAAFLRIAKWNRRDEHGLTLEAVREIKDEYDENQKKNHSQVFSIIDLYRYKSLRANIIPLGALKFMMMFIFYAPGLLLSQFDLNIYINGVVNAASQLCGIPIQGFLLRYPRKFTIYLLFGMSAVFAVGMYLSQVLSNHSQAGQVIQSVLLFFYRISCTIASFIVVVMLNETYPAQVRNLAIFVNISFGRASTLFVPFVVSFCSVTHIPFLLLLAICSLSGSGMACFANETFGTPPPEMIEEVKIKEHNYKHYSVEKDEQQKKE